MIEADDAQAQLSYELAVYREQISMIKRETERVSLTTIDLTNALKTAESLSEERTLIPIGGGAFIKGSVSQTRVLVPIGGEYLLDMERQEAVDELRRRIEATRKAIEKLNDEFNRIVNKLKEVSGQLQKMQSQTALSRHVDENVQDDYI